MKCDNCGNKIKKSFNLCPNCGKKITIHNKKIEEEKKKNRKKLNKEIKPVYLYIILGISLILVCFYAILLLTQNNIHFSLFNSSKEEEKTEREIFVEYLLNNYYCNIGNNTYAICTEYNNFLQCSDKNKCNYSYYLIDPTTLSIEFRKNYYDDGTYNEEYYSYDSLTNTGKLYVSSNIAVKTVKTGTYNFTSGTGTCKTLFTDGGFSDTCDIYSRIIDLKSYYLGLFEKAGVSEDGVRQNKIYKTSSE